MMTAVHDDEDRRYDTRELPEMWPLIQRPQGTFDHKRKACGVCAKIPSTMTKEVSGIERRFLKSATEVKGLKML